MNTEDEIKKLEEEGDILVDKLREVTSRLDAVKSNKEDPTYQIPVDDTRPLVYWKRINPNGLPTGEVYARNMHGDYAKGFLDNTEVQGVTCKPQDGEKGSYLIRCTQYIEGYLLAEIEEDDRETGKTT